MRHIFNEVAIYVNSIGLNEHELLSLFEAAFPNDQGTNELLSLSFMLPHIDSAPPIRFALIS